MALILNIDTSTETGGVCLSADGKTLAMEESHDQKEHASWLHPAIEKIMRDTDFRMKDLQAVAVTSGPGSYTGLRVGMAAAKGFCYALDIPLITENTLKAMAFGARGLLPADDLLCPMIDARRMEVFTAVYRDDMELVLPTQTMVVDENSFGNLLSGQRISFFGGGSSKCKPIITSPNAAFMDVNFNVGFLGILSFSRYLQGEFTGVAYSEPVYTKEFYTHTKK